MRELTEREVAKLNQIDSENFSKIAIPQMATKEVKARQSFNNIAKSCSPEMREYLKNAEKGCREVGEAVSLALELVEEAKKHHLRVIEIFKNYYQDPKLNMLEIDQVLKKLSKLDKEIHCE